MTSICRRDTTKYLIVALLAAAGFLLPGTPGVRAETLVPAEPPLSEQVRLGERIYRQGIGPDGEPIQAVVQGDLTVLGTEFSCVSCHMSAGLGSVEGLVITTPTTVAKLYKPYLGQVELPMSSEMMPLYKAPPPRPAYDDRTLALALRGGIDPAGRALDPVMPRYDLDDRAMALLLAYLGDLSAAPSPGVLADTIVLATVMTEDVPAADRAAVLKALESFITVQNNLRNFTRSFMKGVRIAPQKQQLQFSDPRTLKNLALRVWELKGHSSTWRDQLEEYRRREPVFLLLSGMSAGEWRPVHEFAEANRIPCILPITDFPVVSEENRYSLYFSRGIQQEGETAARFLARVENLPRDSKVIQVRRDDPRGRALATAFRETWEKSGGRAPTETVLGAGETIREDLVKDLLAGEPPAVLLLWLGGEILPSLGSLGPDGIRPGSIFLSATLLAGDLWKLPAPVRPLVRVTYPFKLPQEKPQPVPDGKGKLPPEPPPFGEREPSVRAQAATMLLTEVLAALKNNYFADYVLDLIDMMGQATFSSRGGGGMPGAGGGAGPDYGKLGFGPGQRYAGKGCYVVELAPPGQNPSVTKRSEWVIH